MFFRDLIEITEIKSPFNPHFTLKMDKSLVKVLHFGHLLSIKMVPKPINGADVLLLYKTSFNLLLMQLDAINIHLLY